ncbi:radical SAM protein [Sulfuracidifex metallicus]|uniref:Radical SAM protein n=1 Tax=Sulfuracidifex metallicus DSM 6482 = JCM 9184 TaxID=523847 RepID=A0A6A9QJJ1_SULME|nr:radical SAM protein [Sulfuracidifex metallicus]MUN27888.1 radical SAM protein [Sulfuracidifex metallicus DSM 6482 = JCM 9184]
MFLDEVSDSMKENNFFNLIILPVENWCNFRCKYCYEKFDPDIKFMNEDVIQAIKNLVKNNADKVSKLRISWFGGEPLLAYHIIVDFMQFTNKLSRIYDFQLFSDMTTNGYGLTLERFKELVNLGVKEYEITFDGDEDFHDKLRVRLDDGPTFMTIYSHLVNIHNTSLEFDITIRIHLHQYNKNSVKRLLRRLHDDIGNDFRFSLFIRGISSLLDKDNRKLEYKDRDQFTTDLKETIHEAEALGFRVLKSYGYSVCYASNPRSFVVKPDGSLAKCTVDLYSDRGIIGKIRRDGTLEINEEKYKWWIRGIYNNNQNILSCPLYGERRR